MTDTIERLGEVYENEIINAVKANPQIHAGMHVRVFNHSGIILGDGVILETCWSNFYCQHMAHVQLFKGGLAEAVMECNLERIMLPRIRRVK